MTIPEDHVTSFGNKSYVSYTPKARKDFGSLLCWAENVIGKQIIPCVFQVSRLSCLCFIYFNVNQKFY